MMLYAILHAIRKNADIFLIFYFWRCHGIFSRIRMLSRRLDGRRVEKCGARNAIFQRTRKLRNCFEFVGGRRHDGDVCLRSWATLRHKEIVSYARCAGVPVLHLRANICRHTKTSDECHTVTPFLNHDKTMYYIFINHFSLHNLWNASVNQEPCSGIHYTHTHTYPQPTHYHVYNILIFTVSHIA